MNGSRHILHVDMDAFFAAIEQLDRPDLRGQPVLVGGRADQRGVVAAASYEARKFGCHSAMPMATALRLCPKAVVVAPRGSRYREVSAQVFAILERFTPLVEPLSVDEAFLDVTGSIGLFGQPPDIARQIKERIRSVTGLTGSVGVAPNKFLAKLASDHEKPDGLVVIVPERIIEFLDPLPIARLWGVGKATLPKFEKLGIHSFADARRFSETELQARFGEMGRHVFRLVRGLDDREVIPEREAKSISHEVTFPVDVEDHAHLRNVILDQTDQVARRLRRHGFLGRTVTLKIRTGDFTTLTRSKTLQESTDQTQLLWGAVAELFEEWCRQLHPAVRLIGVGLSNLSPRHDQQLFLFGQEESNRRRQLDRAIDEIRSRFGDGAIGRAGS